MIIRDLVECDGVRKELQESVKLISLSNDKLLLKDSVINVLDIKISNLESIIILKDSQIDLQTEKYNLLMYDYKRERRNLFWHKIAVATVVSAAIAGLTLK